MVNEIPRLSDDEADRIEVEITLYQASTSSVPRNINNCNSSGADGFSAELFNACCSKIGDQVVRALTCGFRNGELSCTQREIIITCIPKGDNFRDVIKDWRPISLLNAVLYNRVSGYC